MNGQGLVVIWSDVEAKMAHYASEVGVCCVFMIALPDSRRWCAWNEVSRVCLGAFTGRTSRDYRHMRTHAIVFLRYAQELLGRRSLTLPNARQTLSRISANGIRLTSVGGSGSPGADRHGSTGKSGVVGSSQRWATKCSSEKRPLNSSLFPSRTAAVRFNPHITSPSQSSPALHQRQSISTVNMRYSAILMLAAGVFAMAQDAQPADSVTAMDAQPTESNTLTGLAKEASRASAMEESQRSAASVDKTATEARNTGLRAEASRASAMEESQRSAASVDKTATEARNTGLRAEASRASAMEESQRSAASVDKTADPRPTGIRGEAARASAMEESQRAAAEADKTAAPRNTGLRAEASRASAMEESQRSAAEADKTAAPRNTGLRAEASRASAMEESQRAAAKSDAESGAQETGFPSHLIGAAGLAFAALL
jgi:hypothetical protein